MAPQQQALLLALQPFHDDNGRPDRKLWADGFESSQPRDIVEVKAVTALYEGLVNHLVEMLYVAARLRGLYAMRNELQHASPGVEAGQVFDDVELLLKTLGRFVKSYLAWLHAHDIALV